MIIYHKLGAKTLSWTVLYYSDYCPISMDHTNGKRNPQRVDTWRAEVTMRHSSLTSPPWDTVSHWTWSSNTCLDWLSSNPRTSSYCSLAEGLQAHVWFFTECWGPELSPASTSVRKPSPQPLAKHILPKYFLYKASQEARRRHCCYCLPGLPNTWHLNATTYWFSPDSNSFSNKINVKK